MLQFFGRETELAHIVRQWRHGTAPVAITGYGGVGKSRLALEAAHKLAAVLAGEEAKGLIVHVPLAAISHVEGVTGVALGALGVTGGVRDPPWDLFVDRLRTAGGISYLVFDNCEHLLPALTGLFERLLSEAPGTRLLVTSRVRTGLPGEHEIPLEPLPLSSAEHTTPEQLMQNPGVALFAHRAMLARPDFAVTPGNAAAVSQLCHRLEGLPLALELTAARSSSLSPRQMLERLETRFDFLTTSRRTELAHHRSLQAALEWSVQLLPPDLALFWCRLAVFRGGFTADAAAAVTGDAYAVHQLAQLRAASLASASEQGEELRFSLLETLREYGAAQQGEDEWHELRRRHAAYFTTWAEEAMAESSGPGASLWLARSVFKHENILAAFDWTLEHDPSLANRLGLAAGRILVVRGQFHEAADILGRAVQANESAGTDVAATLVALAQTGIMLDRQQEARRHLEKAVALSRAAGDEAALANAAGWLMLVLRNQAHFADAWQVGQEALAAARRHAARTGDRRLELDTLVPFFPMWQLGPSREVFEGLMWEIIDLARELGNEWASTFGRAGLAMVAWGDGRYAESDVLFEECLEISRRLGDASGIARAYWGMGYAALRSGHYNEAREHYLVSLEWTIKSGIRWGVHQIAALLAETAIAQGRGRQAAPVLLAVWDKHYIRTPLLEGHLDEAMGVLRSQISADEFRACEAEARAMTHEELLARARAL